MDDYQCGYCHKTEEKTNPDWNKTIITNSFCASFDCLGDKMVVCKVNQPITDRLPMIKHSGRFFHFFSILSDLKCCRSIFSSSINHLWNAKPKHQPIKSSKENTFFQIVKHNFFHFSSFLPLILSNLITFLFLIILNNLKCYRSTTWSFTNHLWNLITTNQHTKNFSILFCFQWFLMCVKCTNRRVQVLFRDQKQWSPPLDLACTENLNVTLPVSLP